MNQTVSEGFSVIQIIQLILAPAVMINACGLLFFGLLFARLNRWRKRLATRSPANNPCPERGFER